MTMDCGEDLPLEIGDSGNLIFVNLHFPGCVMTWDITTILDNGTRLAQSGTFHVPVLTPVAYTPTQLILDVNCSSAATPSTAAATNNVLTSDPSRERRRLGSMRSIRSFDRASEI